MPGFWWKIAGSAMGWTEQETDQARPGANLPHRSPDATEVTAEPGFCD